MRNKKKLYYIISAILFLLFIGPLIYFSNYVILVSDDLCRANLSSGNLFLELREWYNFHNGRFINALISQIPIYDLHVIRFILGLQFILLGFFIFYFTRKLFQAFKLKVEEYHTFFFSILLYVFMVAQLPSIFEGFFWYAAVTVYMLNFILFLLLLLEILNFYLNRRINILFTAVLVVLLNGNNELFIGFTNLSMLAILAREYFFRKKWNPFFILLNFISWVSSLALILAPGSNGRRAAYDYGGNFLGSFKVALIYGGKFIIENVFSLPYLLFYIFSFLFISQQFKGKKITKFINPTLLAIFSYLIIISFSFIVYYATGLHSVRTGRIGNIIKMVLFILIILNILNLVLFLKIKKNLFSVNSLISNFLLIILVIFLLLKNENYVNVREDITQNNLISFEKNYEERIRVLKQTSKDTIKLKIIPNTLILNSGDDLILKEDWIQKCYIQYINNQYNLNVKRINILE